MSSAVIDLSSYRKPDSTNKHKGRTSPADEKIHRDFYQLRLPLEPRDFVGHVSFWPSERVLEPSFDKALGHEIVLEPGIARSIIDLGDTPALGKTRSIHHSRCRAIEKWKIAYFRFGPLILRAEKDAKFPSQVTSLFVKKLKNNDYLLDSFHKSQDQGAVIIIYPEKTNRLDVFFNACRSLNLPSFNVMQVRS